MVGGCLDQKINRPVEVSQQSFALILAGFLHYFHEGRHTWGWDVTRI